LVGELANLLGCSIPKSVTCRYRAILKRYLQKFASNRLFLIGIQEMLKEHFIFGKTGMPH
jgi:hypothetical protein